MKTFVFCLVALTATGTAVPAQQATPEDPEFVVGALLAGALSGGPTALDDRALRPGHAFALRSPTKSQQLAKLMHADVVPGASVLKCGPRPSSCSLGKYVRLVVIGDPEAQSNSDSVIVTVRTTTTTGLSRIPLHTGDTEYTLVRRRGKWVVVSKQITRTT